MRKPYGYAKELGVDTRLDSIPDPAVLEKLVGDLGFIRDGATGLVNNLHWEWLVTYGGLFAQVCIWQTPHGVDHYGGVYLTDSDGGNCIIDLCWNKREGWQVAGSSVGEWVTGRLP
jgi:hypothetical protein